MAKYSGLGKKENKKAFEHLPLAIKLLKLWVPLDFPRVLLLQERKCWAPSANHTGNLFSRKRFYMLLTAFETSKQGEIGV